MSIVGLMVIAFVVLTLVELVVVTSIVLNKRRRSQGIDVIICPGCNQRIANDTAACPQCGRPLASPGQCSK